MTEPVQIFEIDEDAWKLPSWDLLIDIAQAYKAQKATTLQCNGQLNEIRKISGAEH